MSPFLLFPFVSQCFTMTTTHQNMQLAVEYQRHQQQQRTQEAPQQQKYRSKSFPNTDSTNSKRETKNKMPRFNKFKDGGAMKKLKNGEASNENHTLTTTEHHNSVSCNYQQPSVQSGEKQQAQINKQKKTLREKKKQRRKEAGIRKRELGLTKPAVARSVKREEQQQQQQEPSIQPAKPTLTGRQLAARRRRDAAKDKKKKVQQQQPQQSQQAAQKSPQSKSHGDIHDRDDVDGDGDDDNGNNNIHDDDDADEALGQIASASVELRTEIDEDAMSKKRKRAPAKIRRMLGRRPRKHKEVPSAMQMKQTDVSTRDGDEKHAQSTQPPTGKTTKKSNAGNAGKKVKQLGSKSCSFSTDQTSTCGSRIIKKDLEAIIAKKREKNRRNNQRKKIKSKTKTAAFEEKSP